MTEIYLIRHTQAEGNVFRMMQGHWDGDVTELGLKQIDALEERFRNVKIDAVISSDLYRARLTAGALLRGRDLPLITSEEFREINVGPWEQKFFGNVIHENPVESRLFMYDSEKWRIDGAETFADVRKRTCAALLRCCREYEGKTVAIVSHGVAIRCLISGIFDIPLTDIERNPICGNTAVFRLIREDGAFTADYLNDTSHLGSLNVRKWSATRDLRDECLLPMEERDFYIQCYTDAWEAAHGKSQDFNAEPYLRSAQRHAEECSGAVMKIFDGDTPAGLLDLDIKRGEKEGYGWISFLYLMPAYRGKGYGVQILARAVQKCRELGRETVCLSVNAENIRAIRFYERNGFHVIREEKCLTGKLYIMERNIGRKIACLGKK